MLGGVLVAPASADEPSPKSAPVLRFLNYNICGSNDEPESVTPCGPDRDGVKSRVDVLKGLVADWDSDLVFLQEVCRSQYDELMKVLKPKGYGAASPS
ncbi:hypothetical protein ABZT27_34915 [Streptomyces sp. NPDC005389]|uniref:hypothetical protein n=1 Tax=Streptomyces sp. NPDC005389 TaxID=3157040 RepID=UPI0033BCCBDA